MVETYVKIVLQQIEISNKPTDLFKLLGIDEDKNLSIKILLLLKKHEFLNATDLSRATNMSRGAILNQLKNLMEKRLVYKYGTYYYLLENSFSEVVKEIELEINDTLKKLKEFAIFLDKSDLNDN